MNDSFSKETRNYRDPMAPRIEAAKKYREAEEEKYPLVSETYDGFYLRLKEMSEEGNSFFLGAEAIVGSRLSLDREKAQLLSNGGIFLAQITKQAAERLVSHAGYGWRIEVLLNAVSFRAQDKGAVVDIAFICWKPLDAEFDAALFAFTKGIADRFTVGDRAEVRLSQDQFIHVLQSKGAWYLTPSTKREPLEKGTVVYKARRNSIERITGYGLRHRFGCNILATLFWIALAAGIVFLVWYFLFRS